MAGKTTEKLVSVQFTKPYGRYSKGDVAGFPEEQATKLKEKLKVAIDPSTAKKAADETK